MGEAVAKFVHGNLAPDEFSQMVLGYFDSAEWRRWRAARAAEDLKNWRVGRARLLDLIEKARADGYLIETKTVPLKESQDSVVVWIEGGGTGFPSFMPPELVEEAFADILAHAAGRREARIAGRDHEMPDR
jgi:hypothetical protein